LREKSGHAPVRLRKIGVHRGAGNLKKPNAVFETRETCDLLARVWEK